jgi:hypothetical protein
MESIDAKSRFYELWNRGEFGNKPRTWKNYAELEQSGFCGTVAIRCHRGLGRVHPFVPNLNPRQVPKELKKLAISGWAPEDFQISEQLTLGTVIYRINGELTRTENGLALCYSTENRLLREALDSSGRQVFGLLACMTLSQYLWPIDLDELMEIHERYPHHAIEFSGFNEPVGIIPGRRMVIWEVRNY